MKNEEVEIGKEIILCKCGSAEHQILFLWLENDEDKEVYAQIHLAPERSIFKRIVNAIKYIFGYKSQYGAFDEVVLSPSNIKDLEKVIEHLKK